MVEIIASTLTTFLITVLVCIMMKAKEPDTASDTHVEFTFHRTYKIIMLLCAIEGASMTLGIFVMGMVTRVSEEDLVPFLLTVLLFFTLTVWSCQKKFSPETQGFGISEQGYATVAQGAPPARAL